MTDRVKVYKVGPELEDENYVICRNGRIVPFDNGSPTAPLMAIALPHYIAVGGFPPGSVVQVEARCNSLREVELREVRAMLVEEAARNEAFLRDCCTAEVGGVVSYYGPGEWSIGTQPDEGALWNVPVSPQWRQAAIVAIQTAVSTSIAAAINKGQAYTT